MNPGTFWQTVYLWADAHALWLFGVGLTVAVVGNALLWRRDRRFVGGDVRTMYAWPPADARPRVSLLIPAWNEAAFLPACLDSALALQYPEKEIIVCAGGTDGTLEIARRYAARGVIVLEQRPGEGKQRALQHAFARSTGDVIFLTDADCVLEDAVFEETLSPILAGREKVVTGTFRPLDCQRGHPLVLYQWVHHLYAQARMPEYVGALEGVNVAVRRDALEATGGFTVPAPIGTDYRLSHQLRAAGYRIRCVPHSRVQTAYSIRLGEYGLQRSRWFRNRLLYGIRFRAWRDVFGHLWAGLSSLFMLAVPLTGGLGARWLWALWLAGLVHLLLSQTRVVRFAQQQGVPIPRRWGFGLFSLYMVFGWAMTVWGLVEALLPGHRWRW